MHLVVYTLVEDYLTYWLHRFLHTKWGYEKIHHVHHEKTAPSGFAIRLMEASDAHCG
jgi:sterol desaturase/sphingolipid hydroxylase (fatty acid hydroxylase superfamily)